jgi:ADP-ribosylglycohydrolase
MAVGDALGFPVEFIPRKQLERELGPQGITDFLPVRRPGEPAPEGRGRVSDDTMTAMSVAQALLVAGEEPLDPLMEEVSHQLLTWRRVPEGPRGASSSLLLGCDNLARGVGWSMSGVAENEGFGSAVRAIPVALYFRGDRERLLRTARSSSLPTHRHVEAAEAAAAAALLVELALDKASPDQMLAELRVHCTDLKRTPGLSARLQRLEEVQDLPPEQALSEEGLGEGWTAGEAIAQALYCVRRAPDSFEEAVRLAVNGDGDSNSIGALVGAIMGAWHGLDAIPARWRDDVERGVPLRQLAAALHAAWQRRG